MEMARYSGTGVYLIYLHIKGHLMNVMLGLCQTGSNSTVGRASNLDFKSGFYHLVWGIKREV